MSKYLPLIYLYPIFEERIPDSLFKKGTNKLDKDMENMEKTTGNMKMVYSILCSLKKCTIFELQKLTKFKDVDLCLALGHLLQSNQIYQKRIDNMIYYGVVTK